MALIPRPPHTGNNELDSVLTYIVNQLNEGVAQPGIGGGGGGGTPGTDGTDGNSSIYLYARTSTNTAPDRPSDVDFDFSDILSPVTVNDTDSPWSPELLEVTAGAYLWVTFRYVSGTSGEITDASSWDTPTLLGVPGADAATPRVEALRLPDGTTVAQAVTAYDAETLDFSTFRASSSGLQFRNDGGNEKTLVASVRIGGNDASQSEHYTYTYAWTKNGLAFTPAVAGQSLTRRFLVINADDIANGGEDVILCNITST